MARTIYIVGYEINIMVEAIVLFHLDVEGKRVVHALVAMGWRVAAGWRTSCHQESVWRGRGMRLIAYSLCKH